VIISPLSISMLMLHTMMSCRVRVLLLVELDDIVRFVSTSVSVIKFGLVAGYREL